MQLQELFDKTPENGAFRIITNTKRNWCAEIMVDGKPLEVCCDAVWPGGWSVEFSLDGKYRATGAGIPTQILPKVVEMLRAFIDEHKPEALGMTSDSDSRTSLYKKMFARLLPGWNVYVDELHDGTHMNIIKGKIETVTPSAYSSVRMLNFPSARIGYTLAGRTSNLNASPELEDKYEDELLAIRNELEI